MCAYYFLFENIKVVKMVLIYSTVISKNTAKSKLQIYFSQVIRIPDGFELSFMKNASMYVQSKR